MTAALQSVALFHAQNMVVPSQAKTATVSSGERTKEAEAEASVESAQGIHRTIIGMEG